MEITFFVQKLMIWYNILALKLKLREVLLQMQLHF